ncbi:MAG: linear amide C-N hydrolase [Clostridia bacterium]|nr:linear amide C-N hydrolase [Clostridia bacterium]
MCTAIQYNGEGSYFGRNFDFHKTFGEKVVLTPRKIGMSFLHEGVKADHYAIIGTAAAVSDTALYFDAMNEYGICAAALNFPDLAIYREPLGGKINLASFEVIPYVLSSCRSMDEVREMLRKINVTKDSFSHDMPSTGLHWMFSDGNCSLILESTEHSVRLYEAQTGVLTNPPEYPAHLQSFRTQTELPVWDYSSRSRFLKASEIREKYISDGETGDVSLFRLLNAVSVPKGSVTKDEGVHYTKYTAVCDTERLVYYRRIYEKGNISAVKMNELNLDGLRLVFCEG